MKQLPSYLTITNDPSKTINDLIDQWSVDRIGILVDEHTRELCLPKLGIPSSEVIEIESGEKNKNLDSCQVIWSRMTDLGFTRKSLLINLGGGVIGDMGGFAASTYKRGIRFINVPTTLLSQVDASIGGKLGIDFHGLKNHIGMFKEPDQVIVDSSFLSTLPMREMKSGFAEVIKHALIADNSQWDFLKTKPFDALVWDEIIPKSIAIKNRVVNEDPTEKGYRKVLNFGHTIGHALESHFLSTDEPLLHGEAVALGMMMEAYLSFRMGLLSESQFQEVYDYITKVYDLTVSLPNYEAIQSFLLQDKKNDKFGVSFSLIRELGKCDYDVRIKDGVIREMMNYFNQLNK